MSGPGSKVAVGPDKGQWGDMTRSLGTQPRQLGEQPPLASPLAPLPLAWPGPAATLLARPDIFSIV